MSTILSLYIASVKEFVRDRGAIFWTMAFPILFIVLFGVIFNAPASPTDVGVVNLDHSVGTSSAGNSAQQLINLLSCNDVTKATCPGSKSSTIQVTNYTSQDKALSDFRAGKHDIILVIPANFSQTTASGAPTQVTVYFDPSRGAAAETVLGAVQGELAQFSAVEHLPQPILSVSAQEITTHNLTYIAFLVPGILALSLMQLGLFGTAPAIVSLRQDGVLRRLGATPLPRWKLLVSQVEGNWFALIGIVLLGALTFVGIGYFIASIAKTVEAASGISSGVNFPMMFLSGVFFPVASLAGVPVLAVIIKLLPLTYLGDALRQITVQGVPNFPLGVDIAVLAGWFIVCSLLSIRFFKWE